MGREPRTAGKSRVRTRQAALVAATAPIEKSLKQRQPLGAATKLAPRAGILHQGELLSAGNGPGIQASQRLQAQWRRSDRLGHALLPPARPTLALRQATADPELGDLVPLNGVLPGPGRDPQVAGVGPAIAGFLMTPEAADAELTPGPLEHLLHHTDPHHQGLAQAGQGRAQLQQTFPAEQPLARRTVGLLPVVGLHHIEGQQGSVPAGLQQGEVICRAQIPLEPYYLKAVHN